MSDELDTPPVEQVGGKIARGIQWTVASTIATNAARLIFYAAIARLVSPHDQGLVAASMIVFQVASTVRDLGLGAALVQHKAPTRAHERTTYTTSVLIGIVSAAIIAAGAPWLASLLGQPEATPYIRALAVLVVLRGFSAAPVQLCQRAMNFRAVALSDLAGYLVGSATAIALAALGWGAWSLIAGYLVESVIITAWLLRLFPPPRPGIDRGALEELWAFGAGQTVSTIANVVATYGDNAVVARSLPSSDLGFYTRAYDMVRFPAATFQSLVGTVLFPGLSRLQDDQAELGRVFRRVLFAIAVLLLPASAVLVVVAPEFIRVVLGGDWGHAVLPFQVMASGMLFRTNYKAGALVARARGAMRAMAWLQVLYGAVVVGGAALSVRWGITGVAVTTTVAMFVFAVGLTALGAYHAGLGAGEVVACHAPAVMMTIVVGIATWLTAHGLRAIAAPAPVVLFAASAVGGIAFLAAGARSVRRGHPEAVWLWETLRGIGRKVSKRAARR